MYSYQISREQYLTYLEIALREARRKPASILRAVISGVAIPVMGLVLLLSGKAPGWFRIVFLITVIPCICLICFQTFFLKYRARLTLSQAEKTGQLVSDYWQTHQLSLEGATLHCSYGDVKLEVPCERISAFRHVSSFYALETGKNILEIIPENAFSAEEAETFGTDIFRASHARALRELNEHRDKTTETALFDQAMQFTPEELTERIVRMKRLSYRTAAGWTKRELFRLIVPLALAVYSLVQGSLSYALLCLLILIGFNMPLILVFLPPYRTIIRSSLLPPMEDGCYRVTVAFRTVYLYTCYQVLTFPLKELRKIVEQGDLFLYFEGQKMIFVPAGHAAAFRKAISGKRSLAAKAKLPAMDETAAEADAADEMP